MVGHHGQLVQLHFVQEGHLAGFHNLSASVLLSGGGRKEPAEEKGFGGMVRY